MPGDFVLTGNGTIAAGIKNPSDVKNIVVKMLGGADNITFNFTGIPATLAGNLTVDGGSEANRLNVFNMTVNKNLSVTNGTNKIDGTDSDFLQISNTTILGKVAIKNGDGDTTTTFGRTSAGVSFIGKGLSVTNGTGFDFTVTSDFNIRGNVTIKDGLPDLINQAGYTVFSNAVNRTARSVIDGNVSVNYTSGIVISNRIFDTEVTGNVTFNNGSGAAVSYFDGLFDDLPAVIRGNLSIAGKGNSTVFFGTGSSATGLIVGKNVTVTAGDNGSSLNFFRTTIGGATKIQTGAGADNVTIDDSVFHGFQLSTGLGIDTVNIETNGGTANVTQFLGKTKLDLGGGTDTLTLGVAGQATQQVQVFGPTSLSGGVDADTDTLNKKNLLAIFFTPTLNFEVVT